MLVVDDREVTQHPEIPNTLDVPNIQIRRLEAADYCFLDAHSEPLGIERCEIGNLVQKVRSGELEEQLYKCQDNYTSVILLTEGVYDQVEGLLAIHKGGNRGYFRVHVYPHTYYDYIMAVEIRLSEMGIELLHTPNFQCSMTTIKTIYNQRIKPEDEHTLFKRTRAINIPVKLTSNPSVPKLMALANHLGEKVAIRLINRYNTIWDIVHAPDEELLSIEGVGKGLLQNLKRGIGKP